MFIGLHAPTQLYLQSKSRARTTLTLTGHTFVRRTPFWSLYFLQLCPIGNATPRPKVLLSFYKRILWLTQSVMAVQHNVTSNQIRIRSARVWGKFASLPLRPTCGQKAQKNEAHRHREQGSSNWCLHCTVCTGNISFQFGRWNGVNTQQDNALSEGGFSWFLWPRLWEYEN